MTEPASPSGRFSKRTLFLIILGVAAGVAAVVSLIAYTVVDHGTDQEVRLAVIAPLTGPHQALGEAIQRGAEQYAAQVNKAGGLHGRHLKLLVLDDGDDPAKAHAAAVKAADERVIGVIGHASEEAALAAGEVYRERKLAAITPAAPFDAELPANPWLFWDSFDQVFETRFLANYVRNVLGEKTVSIIHPATEAGGKLANAFDEVLQRFGTKVLTRWDYDPAADGAAQDQRLAAIAAEAKDKKLIGVIVVLGDARTSAKALTALRRAEVRNRVVGPRILASTAFVKAVAEEWRNPKVAVASILNEVLTTTPLLFDTAGELAQGFRNGYTKQYRTAPDWLSATAFDATRLLAHSLGRPPRDATPAADPEPAQRQRLRDHLARHDGKHDHFDGLLGPVAFDDRGVTAPMAMVGAYSGVDLIAALTQLSPIREENVGNYLEELVAGRALYVNDRFMYKTNVVYSGLRLDKLTGLDMANRTVTIDFTLWFRWRGTIEPQDIVFTNAVEPIRLDKPERESRNGDMTYRAYRARGKFFLNYSPVERAYGTHVAGLAFHHRSLNRNNLMYVSDVLGMDLNSGLTLDEQITGSNALMTLGEEAADAPLFRRLAAMLSASSDATDPLVQSMLRTRMLAGLSGWALERAWISQEISKRGAEGDPAFVGYGKPAAEFSQVDLGGILKLDQPNARDFFNPKYFLAIAIFALAGALVAAFLDRKDRGQFWRMQTLCLRLVAWPFLLMAGGNLALDYALANMTASTVDLLNIFYSALWWLVPARLAVICLERFVWVPLELRAERKVPNVIRMIAALVIYLFAIFGVVAFVMGQTITSLLATSGLMAMIIGLAIQANIANIFSGIVLNIERPFKVGDYIKLNAQVMGQVVDITWRTIRIRHLEGQLVCLANAKVSEAEIHNYSDMDANFVRTQLFVDPCYDPRLVAKLVKEALDSFDIFQNLASNYFGPGCQFKGVECLGGVWTARYRVKFHVKKGNDENCVLHEVWARIWEKLQQAGIDWSLPPQRIVLDDVDLAEAAAAQRALPAR